MSYTGRWISLLLTAMSVNANAATYAPVEGFAISFLTSQHIADATINVIENGLILKTDANGHFGPIMWPVGEPITMTLTKPGFRTTQTATMIVPEKGLTGTLHNVTFQVPDDFTFYFFASAIGASLDENKCHVVSTITALNKTLDDIPQGETDTSAYLIPATGVQPFYFGVFADGPLKMKTNPFTKGLTATSPDGGVLFLNLEPSDKPYIFAAKKPGVSFTSATFYCHKGMFVNISPPQGPTVL